MNKLLIVESPTKAKTIGKYLGNDYTVLASVGHVRDLPKSNKDAVDIEGGFIPRYVISADKYDIIGKIKKAAQKADEIYLATDPDREGEAIAWHLAEIIKEGKNTAGAKIMKRVVYHEITKDAIEEALDHPRNIDENLRRAQEARRVLDRIVGYDLSGLIWKKVRYGLSAGRVQSPALRILAEREREIKAFIPVTYFVLSALFKNNTDKTNTKSNSSKIEESNKNKKESLNELQTVCVEQPATKEEAEKIVRVGKNANWRVADVTEKCEDRNPRPPFTTSTLQQTASTRLGFAPSRTMRAAQKLYEAGYITYMRTDSVNLSKEAVAKMAGVVEREFGKEYVQVRMYKTSSKNAQEAHEAVRITDPTRARAGSTPDEAQLYDLIRIRSLSSQMASAKIMRTNIAAKADVDIPLFTANGSRVLFPGWLALDTKARGEDVELPKLTTSDPLSLISLTSDEKQTEPPNRYTEAGLIKELEKRGIGRPSTYASTMKTIQDRGYVEKLARALKPTATGMVVSGWLEEHFPKYVSDTFTAEMEDELDEIARGERGYTETLTAFYGPFQKAVQEKDMLPKATSLGDVSREFICPLCSSSMENKLSRNGIFMSCKKYPECLGARTEEGAEMKSNTPIGNHPDTGAPVFIKTGRFGPYVEMTLPDNLTKTDSDGRSDLSERSDLPSPDDNKKLDAKKETRKSAQGGSILDGKVKSEKKKISKKNKIKKANLKRASIPAGTDLSKITLADAVKYLSLPRELGINPSTSKIIFSNTGRFGPYVGSDGEFRSLKAKDGDPYTVTFETAHTLLMQPKRPPAGSVIVKEVGKHPRTGKNIILYQSKQGLFLKKGLRRIYLSNKESADTLTPTTAAEYLK